MTTTIEAMPASRAEVLHELKNRGPLTPGEIARQLGTTREAVRQQLALLENDGWIRREGSRKSESQGRPSILYALTPAGDHLFPKRYDELSVRLVDTLAEQVGEEALHNVLAALTDSQVAQWESKLANKTLEERIEALKGFYFEQDPHTHVERDDKGWLLVERNCPFLNLALERPKLCSVTVSALTRLLGVQVSREAKFQQGDHRCAFRILADRPAPRNYRFGFEEDS